MNHSNGSYVEILLTKGDVNNGTACLAILVGGREAGSGRITLCQQDQPAKLNAINLNEDL